jgi:hypothetical protein
MQVIELNDTLLIDFEALQKRSDEIFSSARWALASGKALKRFCILDDHQKLVGGFVAYEGGKSWFKTLVTPPFASHCGLFLDYHSSVTHKRNSFEKKVLDAIADFLKKSNYAYYQIDFPNAFTDMQSFVWKGLNVEVKYTYQVDLTQTEEMLRTALDQKLRNVINKFEKEEGQLEFSSPSEDTSRLITTNFVNHQVKWKEDVFNSLMKADFMKSAFAKINGKIAGVAITAGQGKCTYYLFGAVDRTLKNNAAGPAALFHAILQAKSQGFEIFDFEGSMIPEIEKYFRQFGGKLIPHFTINGGRGPWPRLYQWRNK